MWRNIFIWAIGQIAIIFFVLFGSAKVFGLDYNTKQEFFWKVEDIEKFPDFNGTIVPTEATPKCIVYTMVFQTFVFLQLFNMINARKLGIPASPGKPAQE